MLGFSDIVVSTAHRAILLIDTALTPQPENTTLSSVRPLILAFLAYKYPNTGAEGLADELLTLRCHAYQALLSGLIGCADYKEGKRVAKKARKLYPGDIGLRSLEEEIEDWYQEKRDFFKKGKSRDREKYAQWMSGGAVISKNYPWMNQDLYKRTPETLRQVNKTFKSTSCEVKPVVFKGCQPRSLQEGEDVGPLGIFTKKAIQSGQSVLVDLGVTSISDVPSSKREHCDTCHGSLQAPYASPQQIVHVSCCLNVAYCSLECCKTAINDYHKVLCGKDFDWLYDKHVGVMWGETPQHKFKKGWMPVMFLRVVAVVLTDMRNNPKLHPLAHSLLARLSANYPSGDKILNSADANYSWTYVENVVTPTKILIQLGVNVFNDQMWTQEVIQTIYHRIENNANRGTVNLHANPVQMINLNPDYIFFNHSCDPNTNWHGAISHGNMTVRSLQDMNGKLMQSRSSAV